MKTTNSGISDILRKVWEDLSVPVSDSERDEQERKRSILAFFLMIGIAVFFPFTIYHFMLGNVTRAILLLLVGSVQLASLVALRYIRRATIIFRLNVILLGAYFLFLVTVGGTHGSRILWLFVFPMFAFFLLGKREGLLWSALLVLFSLMLFIDPATFFGTFPYENEVKTRFLITYTVILLISYFFEATRQRYQVGMEQARNELEERVEQRTAELSDANEKFKKEIRERTLAEEALKAAEQEKELILSSVMEHVVYEDRDMKILWANRAACESAGLTKEEIMGRHCYEIWPQRDDPCPDCSVQQAMKTGKPREVEKTTPDGRAWLIRGYPVYDSNNEIVGGIEVTLETTERKRAEVALNEAYNILDMSPASAFLWKNEEGWPVEFVTDNVESLFGYTAEELMSGEVPYSETVHPDDLDRVAKEISDFSAKEGRQAFTHEPYRIVTKSGVVKWADDRTYVRRDESGAITHYQGIVEDITERMRMEEALKESEKKYRSILDNISDFIFTHDLEGRFLTVNLAATQTIGYTPDELIGKPINDFMLPEYRQAFKDEYLVQVRKQGFFNGVSIFLAKNGKSHHMEYRATVVGREGEDPYVSGVGRDITENIEAMGEVKKLEKQFQNAQKMEAIATLAGGIAHDFNNLLMGIQGNASLMLLDTDSSHTHYEKLKNIEQYVQNGADLTKQLLGFARGGKYVVQPTDLNDLVKKSSDMFGRTKKEISIHPKYHEGVWTVEVDQGQIEQMLLNLYVNAWQAMPGGGELYLQTENVILDENDVKFYDVEVGKYVKISITDTGVGMDEATQQRIFDPFFTTKEMGRGTGLGLASVYGIIKNHGGIINVYSEKGKGTTFNIYLPASEKEVIEDKILSEEVLKGTETVLLVDDEEMITGAGGELLEEIGYRVLIAGSGKEAIDVYEKNRDEIDLVILDMTMPVMGGGETYDRLKETNPDIKVLLSSGYSIDGEASEILDRGCNGFIQKPFNVKELSRRIREILDKK